MKKYICEPCGYEYDPAIGDPATAVLHRARHLKICRTTGYVQSAGFTAKTYSFPPKINYPFSARHLIVVQNLYFISGRQTNQSLVLKRNQHPGQGWSRRIQIRSQFFPIHMQRHVVIGITVFQQNLPQIL